MAQKTGIDGKRLLGCHYNKRLMGFGDRDKLMYEEIYKLATGTDIALTDSKRDIGRISGVEFASVQNGIPTPDSPIPILNTGDGGILNITSSNGTVTDTYPINLPDGFVGGSLPNGVHDTYELIGGEWKFVQRVGKVVFNGSERWIDGAPGFGYSSTLSTCAFAITVSGIRISNINSNIYIQSNRFKGNIWFDLINGLVDENENGITGNNANHLIIRIKKETIGILETDTSAQRVIKFKAKLAEWNTAGIPLYAEYELATPIIHNAEDILINTYGGYNKIECLNAVKSVMTVKYLEK